MGDVLSIEVVVLGPLHLNLKRRESISTFRTVPNCFVTMALNESISGNAIYTTEMPCFEVLLWARMFVILGLSQPSGSAEF